MHLQLYAYGVILNICIHNLICVPVVCLNWKMNVILFTFHTHIHCILITSTLTVSLQSPLPLMVREHLQYPTESS